MPLAVATDGLPDGVSADSWRVRGRINCRRCRHLLAVQGRYPVAVVMGDYFEAGQPIVIPQEPIPPSI